MGERQFRTANHDAAVETLKRVAEFKTQAIRDERNEGRLYAELADVADRAVLLARCIDPESLFLLPSEPILDLTRHLNSLYIALEAATRRQISTAEELKDRVSQAHTRVLAQSGVALLTARWAHGWPREEAVMAAGEALKRRIDASAKAEESCAAVTAACKRMMDELRPLGLSRVFAKESEVFSLAARAHSWAAFGWLMASLAVGVLLVWGILDAAFWHEVIPAIKEPATAAAGATGTEAAGSGSVPIGAIATRALLYATVSTFLLLALRQFSAAKHNAVVNRHRANALSVYGPLVTLANNNDRVRDLVLSHAAASIFAPQPTGLSRLPMALDQPSASAILAAVSGREKSAGGA